MNIKKINNATKFPLLVLMVSAIAFIIMHVMLTQSYSKVVYGDPNNTKGVTDEQWAKYKGPCMNQINTKYASYPGKLPQNFVDLEMQKCIKKKVGITWRRKNARGWHPMRAQTRNGRPYVKPWDPRNPRKFNVYQYCLGRSKTSCNKNCNNYRAKGFKTKSKCLVSEYQCKERVQRCVCNYKYDVVSVETCYPKSYWSYKKNKTYQWYIPSAIMGKGYQVVRCLRKNTPYFDSCNRCANYTRCKKVCELDREDWPSFSSSIDRRIKTTTQCKQQCYNFLWKPAKRWTREGVPHRCPAKFFK